MNEYEATHIFAHFVKDIGTHLCILMCFILRLLKKITDFLGKILKHIRTIRNDLQIKFDRMLSVCLFNVKNQKK